MVLSELHLKLSCFTGFKWPAVHLSPLVMETNASSPMITCKRSLSFQFTGEMVLHLDFVIG